MPLSWPPPGVSSKALTRRPGVSPVCSGHEPSLSPPVGFPTGIAFLVGQDGSR